LSADEMEWTFMLEWSVKRCCNEGRWQLNTMSCFALFYDLV